MSIFNAALAILLSAGATDLPSNAAADSTRQVVHVAAIAADVHAVVLRAPDGQLTRYDEGAAIGPEWRVKRVERDAVTLVAKQRLGGQAVEVRLLRDQSIDLGAASDTLDTLRAPVHRPQRTQWVPQKRQSAANH